MDIIDSDTKGTQNKTLIEKALKKVENSNCNSLLNLSGVSCSESKDDQPVRRSQEAYICPSQCISCQKDKLIKGTSNYEKMVQNVCDFLQDIKSPFETRTELFNISSGVVADKAVTADILGAEKTGKDACEKFVEERLVKGVVEFFDPITKNNLKSFGTMAKQVKIKLKNREISIKADRSLFARLIVMAQNRSFNIRDVLSYSLGPLSWSIALADGSLVKNNKAQLLQFLEKDMLPLDTVR